MIKWLTRGGRPDDPNAATRPSALARTLAEVARLGAAVGVVLLAVEPGCQRAVLEALSLALSGSK